MKKIYTIGSSNRSRQEFINLLKAYKIEALLDVRRFPKSRFPHFEKENLSGNLDKEGFEYFWFGKELGGYRKGGYEKYLDSEEFKKGLSKIEEIAEKKSSCIMCAERFPWKCHRRFIAQALEKNGWRVIHILGERKTWIRKK